MDRVTAILTVNDPLFANRW